jgi:hypothetical protein
MVSIAVLSRNVSAQASTMQIVSCRVTPAIDAAAGDCKDKVSHICNGQYRCTFSFWTEKAVSSANPAPEPRLEISYSCGGQVLTQPTRIQGPVSEITLNCSAASGAVGAAPPQPGGVLVQAIAAAERATGGIAVSATAAGGKVMVTTINGGTNLVNVDPQSGRVLGTRKGGPVLSKADFDTFASSTLGLEGAITAAEKETNGKATAVTAVGGSAPHYSVEALTNGASEIVSVDPGNGQVSHSP